MDTSICFLKPVSGKMDAVCNVMCLKCSAKVLKVSFIIGVLLVQLVLCHLQGQVRII